MKGDYHISSVAHWTVLLINNVDVEPTVGTITKSASLTGVSSQ